MFDALVEYKSCRGFSPAHSSAIRPFWFYEGGGGDKVVVSVSALFQSEDFIHG